MTNKSGRGQPVQSKGVLVQPQPECQLVYGTQNVKLAG